MNEIDFTLIKYFSLLNQLKCMGYSFITFEKFITNNERLDKFVVLRHDVDLLPFNSLRTAEIEASLGISGVYYFRAVPKSWDENVIKKIQSLEHEVGYHYESLTTCNGDIDAAYQDFCNNLGQLRRLVDVKTICMHGSPRSPYDSKDIWKKYSYRDKGIIGEPYFDTDFSDVFYLTDTGRRWDGFKVSVRDRIEGFSEEWEKTGLVFHTTSDIIRAATKGLLPNHIMMTVHPQRWNPFGWQWCKEYVLQNAKNIVKRIIVRDALLK